MLKYIRLKEEHAKLTLRWRLMPHVTKFMLSDIDEDLEKLKKWVKSIINNKRLLKSHYFLKNKYLENILYFQKKAT